MTINEATALNGVLKQAEELLLQATFILSKYQKQCGSDRVWECPTCSAAKELIETIKRFRESYGTSD